jgi:hypothetical protein
MPSVKFCIVNLNVVKIMIEIRKYHKLIEMHGMDRLAP